MRRLLAVPLVLLGLAAASPARAADCARTLRGIDLQTATMPQLQRAMADGRVTSADLVQGLPVRIDARRGAQVLLIEPAAKRR